MKLPTNASFVNLIGFKTGRWSVVSYSHSTRRGHAVWNCVCECGTKKKVMATSLRRGLSTSCGCYLKELLQGGRHPYAKRPYESLFNWLRANAKRTKKSCSITYKQFIKFTKKKFCFYCGTTLFWTKFNINKNGSNYNLDRKDNTKGYSVDNCVVCCPECNELKSDLPFTVFMEKIRKIYRRHYGKS
jgi:hypothetical protein